MSEFKFDERTNNLFRAILRLKTVPEAEAFFRDLCTIQELEEIRDRWQIVELLDKKMSYRDIAQKLKISTTTVGRVANWITNGQGGYKLIFKRLNSHHHSLSSGRG